MSEKQTILFNHTGNIGDLLYALPMIIELKEATNYNIWLHLQTNVQFNYAVNHPNANVGFTNSNVDFIIPLLKNIKALNKITFGDAIPENNQIIDLAAFRKLNINQAAGNICQWYYNLINIHLPQNFSRQHIHVSPDFRFRDKVIFVRTKRYNNVFLDLNVLKKYADNFIFFGLQDEHDEFCKLYFDVEYFKIENMLEFAQILSGSRGIISNQNGLYCCAELLKVPRILLTPEYMKMNDRIFPGPVDNNPQGGWFEVVQSQNKLINAVENLIRL